MVRSRNHLSSYTIHASGTNNTPLPSHLYRLVSRLMHLIISTSTMSRPHRRLEKLLSNNRCKWQWVCDDFHTVRTVGRSERTEPDLWWYSCIDFVRISSTEACRVSASNTISRNRLPHCVHNTWKCCWLRAQLQQPIIILPVFNDECVFHAEVDIRMANPDELEDIYPMLGMFHFAKVVLDTSLSVESDVFGLFKRCWMALITCGWLNDCFTAHQHKWLYSAING